MLGKIIQTLIYILFGCGSTVVNTAAYYISFDMFTLSNVVSTMISWFVAVVFMYITTKLFVFHSPSFQKEVLQKEVPQYFGSRIFTGILEVASMYILVDVLHLPDVWMRGIVNVTIGIMNYLFSMLMVFKKC